MNLPSLKRAIPVLTLIAIAFVLVMLPRFDGEFFPSTRYAQCGKLVKTEPAKALALARSWRKEHPASPLGAHCEALALFATKDYLRAAEAFVALAKMTTDNPALATRLFVQGSQAYEAAGKTDQAKQTVTAALLLSPNDNEAKDELTELAKKKDILSPTPASPATIAAPLQKTL